MKINGISTKLVHLILKKEIGKFEFCYKFRESSITSRPDPLPHSNRFLFRQWPRLRLAILTYHEFSVMLRLLTGAPLTSTIFEFMDCVEIVLDVDKPLGAR